MTARERRRALAAIGRDLLASEGGPGERRGMALMRRLAGEERPAIAWEDLPDVPEWMRLPRAARQQVAHRAALLSMAPALAASIDGAVLRGHAEIAGEAALDWAIDQADALPACDLPTVGAEALDARGLALMRAALPERLRPLIDPGAEPIDPPAAIAAACVSAALKGAVEA